jgi:transcriptional regulator with XRE-family HTH domain
VAFRIERGSTLDWPSAIKKFRRRAGLKQQVLAEMLGCDQTAISHWERGVDRPSLAFQRRLLEMIARDQRAMEDLRLFTAVERSPGVQALLDNDLRILAGSSAFWDFYNHVNDKNANMFREFGREDNKQLAREALDSAAEILVIEVEVTAKPKGAHTAVRMRGIGTPVVLSDSTIALRVELLPTDGDVDVPLKSQFVGIDDLKDE